MKEKVTLHCKWGYCNKDVVNNSYLYARDPEMLIGDRWGWGCVIKMWWKIALCLLMIDSAWGIWEK